MHIGIAYPDIEDKTTHELTRFLFAQRFRDVCEHIIMADVMIFVVRILVVNLVEVFDMECSVVGCDQTV